MAASDGGPLVEWILFLLSAPPCWVHFTTSQMSVSVFHRHDSPEGLYFSRKTRWFIHKCYVITILMLRYIKHTHTHTCSTHRHLHEHSNHYLHMQKLKWTEEGLVSRTLHLFQTKSWDLVNSFQSHKVCSDFSSCSTWIYSSIIYAWCPRFYLVSYHFILKSEIISDVY